MWRSTTIHITCSLLILLFVYTGISKLYDHSIFEMQLQSFPYISRTAVTVSWLLPLAELFTAILLFIPATQLAGLYISLMLLCTFTIYLIVMQITQSHLPCSCGGIISKLSWKQHIIFNISLIIINVAGIFSKRSGLQKKPV